MDALTLLHTRNSAPRLISPSPKGEALENILKAALRAPDHARLKPYRFLTIEGEHRDALGQVFVNAANKRKERNGDRLLTDNEAKKLAAKPLRAPLIVVVIASTVKHHKVPEIEQLLSAGCAAHSILLSAQALGFAGIWRTGSNAFDSLVNERLGLAENESIVGFIYLGTIDGDYKTLMPVSVADYCSEWQGA